MSDETPEQIKALPDYIDNVGTSVGIYGWGAPFLVWMAAAQGQTEARGVSLARRVCYINGDPFQGKQEQALLGVYGSEEQAEAAIKSSPAASLNDRVAYAFYRGPENTILPTMITATTAPRLTNALKAVAAQEQNDADQAAKTVIEVFLAMVSFRGDGQGSVSKVIRRIRGKPSPPPDPTPATLNNAKAVAALPKGAISPAQMLKLVREIWSRNPLLQRLHEIQKLPRAEQHAALLRILADFQKTSGIIVERVKTGTVQAARGRGNFGSIRSRSGYLQLEEHAYQNTEVLLEEVNHELAFFYSGGNYYTKSGAFPFLARFPLNEWVEMAVVSGEAEIVKTLTMLPQ